MLLLAGARVNHVREKRGDTALFISATKGHCAIVALLESKGADINAVTVDECTSLWSVHLHVGNQPRSTSPAIAYVAYCSMG
jgi:ankyrin repeat protein